ncbi:hypothetical protein [Paenibacillus xanthanilyticus]|uniref:Uncharacterized protein n=1 Tax=Paenibacillus xanthanilyticus TaxID=1783531 RepID=A0ABV8JXS0_9BACL
MEESLKVYVLLTDTGTIFTRLIKLFTKVSLNHASIALDPSLEEVYSFGRKCPRNPWIGGFVREDVRGELFDDATCAVFYCKVDRDSYERMKSRIEEIQRNEHQYKYNLLGLFGILLNKRIKRERAYFCTQFVAAMLEMNGIAVSAKPSELTTPYDFEQTTALRTMYRGSLRSYIARQKEDMRRSAN